MTETRMIAVSGGGWSSKTWAALGRLSSGHKQRAAAAWRPDM